MIEQLDVTNATQHKYIVRGIHIAIPNFTVSFDRYTMPVIYNCYFHNPN